MRHDVETVGKAMADAREGLSVQLEAFAANTMEYLKQERDLLLDGVGVPDVGIDFAGRHCLIVVRGYDYKADLDVLRPYIRESLVRMGEDDDEEIDEEAEPEDWDAEADTSEGTVTFSAFQDTIERDVDDDEEEDA